MSENTAPGMYRCRVENTQGNISTQLYLADLKEPTVTTVMPVVVSGILSSLGPTDQIAVVAGASGIILILLLIIAILCFKRKGGSGAPDNSRSPQQSRNLNAKLPAIPENQPTTTTNMGRNSYTDTPTDERNVTFAVPSDDDYADGYTEPQNPKIYESLNPATKIHVTPGKVMQQPRLRDSVIAGSPAPTHAGVEFVNSTIWTESNQSLFQAGTGSTRQVHEYQDRSYQLQ
jgi:hypothetical protein